jgi:hypothetical protein
MRAWCDAYRSAVHDAAEDVDEDGLDLRVLCDDVERVLDSVGCHTTTAVEEVGRLTAIPGVPWVSMASLDESGEFG